MVCAQQRALPCAVRSIIEAQQAGGKPPRLNSAAEGGIGFRIPGFSIDLPPKS